MRQKRYVLEADRVIMEIALLTCSASRIASEIYGREIEPRECVIVLMAVKLSREAFKHKRDNLVDLIGYADILNEVTEHEELVTANHKLYTGSRF